MAFESEWETSSGLALDGATVTVTACEFGFNANMGAGVTCANFVFETDDGEEIEQSFSTGAKFEASRDGSAIEGRGRVSRTSNYGLLMESVKDVCTDDPGKIIGNPREAAGWVGTKWVFGTIDRETTNPTTGITRVTSKFIVTKYLGKTSGKTSDKASKSSKSNTPEIPDGIDSELWEELVQLAGQHDEQSEFAAEALTIEAVENCVPAQRAVMRTGAGSVWAAR